jgi:hypothetical protein
MADRRQRSRTIGSGRWFETDLADSYPKESITPDNIIVKLKANAQQNAMAT